MNLTLSFKTIVVICFIVTDVEIISSTGLYCGPRNYCEIQQWSEWSACNATCGKGVHAPGITRKEKYFCCNTSRYKTLAQCLGGCNITMQWWQTNSVDVRTCGHCKYGTFNSTQKACDCQHGFGGQCCDAKTTRSPTTTTTTTTKPTTTTPKPTTTTSKPTTTTSKPTTTTPKPTTTTPKPNTTTTKQATITPKSTTTTAKQKTTTPKQTTTTTKQTATSPKPTTTTTKPTTKPTTTTTKQATTTMKPATTSTKLMTTTTKTTTTSSKPTTTTSNSTTISTKPPTTTSTSNSTTLTTKRTTKTKPQPTTPQPTSKTTSLHIATVRDCMVTSCHNGVCATDSQNHKICVCEDGYEGDFCEIDKDECASDPCLYGTCIDKVDNFQCECLIFFNGKRCSKLKTWALVSLGLLILSLLACCCWCWWCIFSKCDREEEDNKVKPIETHKPLPASKANYNSWY